MSRREITATTGARGGGIAGLGIPLFLTTLSALVLELSLTRLFSVVLFYHYAFLAISLAVLGLASGGIIARLLPRNMSAREHRSLMSKVCMAACVAVIPALQFTLHTDVWLVTSWETALRLAMLFLLFLIPFGLAGFVIASTIVAGSHRIASLYFFDLLGGGLGCLLFVPIMAKLGGPNAVLTVGLLWALTAAVWAVASRSRALLLGCLVLCAGVAALIVVNHEGAVLDVRYTRGKPVGDEVFAAWNSFSRVSVQRDENEPDKLWILIDGGAGTWLSDTDVDAVRAAGAANFGWTGPDMAFWLRAPESALVIGAGGGVDVVRALLGGSRHTTAVEINPLIARTIMLDEFGEHTHGLYARPDVKVVVEDGRSFVRRTERSFDVIQLSQVDTWAASAAGSYALTEGYLYTVEAFEDYLARLRRGGLLSVTRWEFRRPRETLRVVSVALAALERSGVADPADHLLVIVEDIDREGLMRMGTVIVGVDPLTPSQVDAVRARAIEGGMRIAYAPKATNGDPAFTDLILADRRDEFLRAYDFNVAPVFDDSPFFFFMGRWKNTFADLFAFDPSGDSVNTGAQFLLVAVLILATLAIAVFLFGPLLLYRRSLPIGRDVLPYLAFCISVGLGYMLVELSMIHRFIVFLGQPVYSLTVVVFLFLLSSGLGSRWSERFAEPDLSRRLRPIIAGIALLLLAYLPLIPWLTREFQAQPLYLKAILVGMTVFPLGFLMGVPFPSALRLAAATGQHVIEWLWALNAAATVLGSVLAIFLFVTWGIRVGMLAGAVAYTACGALTFYLRVRPARQRVDLRAARAAVAAGQAVSSGP